MAKSDQEFDEALIEEVRNYRFLFDPGHNDYQNVQKKSKVWRMISRKLNVDEHRCKQRWKGLRATYMRCRRTEQSMNRTSDFCRPKGIFFKTMSFLDDISKPKYTNPREPQEELEYLFSSDSDISLDDDNDLEHSIILDEDQSALLDDFKEEALESIECVAQENTSIEINRNDDDVPIEYTSIESIPAESVLIEEVTQNHQEPSATEVQRQATLSEKIDKFFELTATTLSDTCLELIQRSKQDSISLYFASLAAKIKEANMPQRKINQIKSRVTEIVFSEIEEYLDSVEVNGAVRK